MCASSRLRLDMAAKKKRVRKNMRRLPRKATGRDARVQFLNDMLAGKIRPVRLYERRNAATAQLELSFDEEVDDE